MNDDKLIRCLTQGCSRISCSRGLCYRCYNRLLRRIKKGETTMAAEEQEGRVRATKKSQWTDTKIEEHK